MAPITQQQINATFGDASVTLPKSFTCPDHWPDWDMDYYGEPGFRNEWEKWQADPDAYKPLPKTEN